MSALTEILEEGSLEQSLHGVALDEKKEASFLTSSSPIDDGDDAADDSADPSSASPSNPLDPAEKKRLANKRKKEKAKQRKHNKPPTAAPSPSSVPTPSPSPELLSFASSFPTLSMHRFFTPPLQLAFNLRKGRHVLVTERVVGGATVFSQPPYAAVVRDVHVASLCHRCLSPSSVLLKCATCGHAHYCSSTCKVAHARIHQHECRVLSSIARSQEDDDSTAIRLMIRILVQRAEENAAIERHREKLKGKKAAAAALLPSSLQPGLTFPDVIALQSHVDTLSGQDRLSLLSMLSAFLPALQPLLTAEGEGEGVLLLLRLLCIIHVNAHHVQNHNKDRLALGLYTAPSLMNHSCAPTCCYHFGERGELIMKAMDDVPAGGELTYAYVDAYQARELRWTMLARVYKMGRCDCDRCQQRIDLSWDRFVGGLQCNACREGLLTVVETAGLKAGRCDRCARDFSAVALRECEDESDALCQQALSLFSSQQHALVASTIRTKLLAPAFPASALRPHPFAFPSFQSYFMLLPTLSALGEHAEVAQYAALARECLEGAGLAAHPEYADVLVMEGEAIAKQGNAEDGRVLLERAREGRERLYGKRHVLTKDVLQRLSRLQRGAIQ